VGGPASADRLIQRLPKWIEKNLRLKVNVRKSGTGRPWERKFLGFRIPRNGLIEVSPESLNRFEVRVRQLWDGRQNGTSKQLRDRWQRFIRGWWNYYGLAEWRRPIFDLEGWIRRHIRKCFWIRWHNSKGRRNALKRLGNRGRLLQIAYSSRGAWRISRNGALNRALSNQVLLLYGLLLPSDLAIPKGVTPTAEY
jgi:RNA-directed DNA polymerase